MEGRRTLSEPEPVTGPWVYTEAVYLFYNTLHWYSDQINECMHCLIGGNDRSKLTPHLIVNHQLVSVLIHTTSLYVGCSLQMNDCCPSCLDIGATEQAVPGGWVAKWLTALVSVFVTLLQLFWLDFLNFTLCLDIWASDWAIADTQSDRWVVNWSPALVSVVI